MFVHWERKKAESRLPTAVRDVDAVAVLVLVASEMTRREERRRMNLLCYYECLYYQALVCLFCPCCNIQQAYEVPFPKVRFDSAPHDCKFMA